MNYTFHSHFSVRLEAFIAQKNAQGNPTEIRSKSGNSSGLIFLASSKNTSVSVS